MLAEEVFLDSVYPIALASSTDQHHGRAVAVAAELRAKKPRIITTRAIVLEIGNALAKPRFRPAAIELLQSLAGDPLVEIVPLSEPLCQRGFELFRKRPDKAWSLTDCISFVVMEDRRLQQALTHDEHFEQAGFRALLRG